jgi:hypothetical protein
MKYWLVLLLALLVNGSFAQSCLHTDLSNKFNYKVTLLSHETDSGFHNQVQLIILQKPSKAVTQKISFQAEYLFEDAYKDCNAVRSYITGKNKGAEIMDYDAGDLIIADLNFDGKEDIAIKNDSGGNGGPTYNYYLQTANGQFKKDIYLSENMRPFPSYINGKRKILITLTHASAMKQGETTYQYNTAKRKWRIIKHILVD